MFALDVNDLAQGIKQAKLSTVIDDMTLGILLYADDIVSVAEREINLEKMLNIMSFWCNKWRFSINTEKTQIIPFRNNCVQQNSHIFHFGSMPLKYTTSSKCLGFVLMKI